jgi:hypothetical protein
MTAMTILSCCRLHYQQLLAQTKEQATTGYHLGRQFDAFSPHVLWPMTLIISYKSQLTGIASACLDLELVLRQPRR